MDNSGASARAKRWHAYLLMAAAFLALLGAYGVMLVASWFDPRPPQLVVVIVAIAVVAVGVVPAARAYRLLEDAKRDERNE